jgi:hypothetical protein
MGPDRNLDDEGVPDLEAPLPEKEATGDPQEGLPPPNEQPRASTDWGTTRREQRMPEPIGVRVARKEPDFEEQMATSDEQQVTVGHPDDDASASGGADAEKDLVAREADADGLEPEEQALRVEEEPPDGTTGN